MAPRKGWPKTLTVRQVTRRRDDHQTPILTSRSDLSAITVAHRMLVGTGDRSTLVPCPLPRACQARISRPSSTGDIPALQARLLTSQGLASDDPIRATSV